MLRPILLSQIEEKLWAQRRLSNNDEAPKPSSLQFTPLNGGEHTAAAKLSPISPPEKLANKKYPMHLDPDEESEVKVENPAHAAGC